MELLLVVVTYPLKLFTHGLFAATEIVVAIMAAIAFFVWPLLLVGGIAGAIASGDTGTYAGVVAELCWLLILIGYDLESDRL